MGLKETILRDLTQAMKDKDEVRLSALRLIKTEITRKEKEKGEALKDEAIIQVLQSMSRKFEEAVTEYEKVGQPERATREKTQLATLQSYLPEQLSPEEVEQLVKEVIDELGASSPQETGKVMGKVMPKLKESGKLVDGKLVSEIVRRSLGA